MYMMMSSVYMRVIAASLIIGAPLFCSQRSLLLLLVVPLFNQSSLLPCCEVVSFYVLKELARGEKDFDFIRTKCMINTFLCVT